MDDDTSAHTVTGARTKLEDRSHGAFGHYRITYGRDALSAGMKKEQRNRLLCQMEEWNRNRLFCEVEE